MKHSDERALSARKLLLLVDGKGGDQETWGCLPDLIREDTDFRGSFDVQIYRYGKPGKVADLWKKNELPIPDLAKGLTTEIRNLDLHPDYQEVILLGHSFGGLVAKQYLVDLLESKKEGRISKVILAATPSQGIEIGYLRALFSFSSNFENQANKDSFFLKSLNERWAELEVSKYVTVHPIGAGLDQRVTTESARGDAKPSEAELVITEDHISLVKVSSIDDKFYKTLKRLLLGLLDRRESSDRSFYRVAARMEADPGFSSTLVRSFARCLVSEEMRREFMAILPFTEIRVALNESPSPSELSSAVLDLAASKPRGIGAAIESLLLAEKRLGLEHHSGSVRSNGELHRSLQGWHPLHEHRWEDFIALKWELLDATVSQAVALEYVKKYSHRDAIELPVSNCWFIAGMDSCLNRGGEWLARFILACMKRENLDTGGTARGILGKFIPRGQLSDYEPTHGTLAGDSRRALSGLQSVCVQIAIHPEPGEGPPCYSTTVYYREGRNGRGVNASEEKWKIEGPLDSEQLTTSFLELFSDVLDKLDKRFRKRKVSFEFFIPWELWHLPVERITMPGLAARELGWSAKVSCRLHLRHFHNRYSDLDLTRKVEASEGRWHEKWHAHTALTEPLRWEHVYAPDELLDKGDSSSDEEQFIYASLLPVRGKDCSKFSELVDEGFPIALWFRRASELDSEACALLEELIIDSRSQDLPTRLQRLRKRNHKGAPLWRDLALLWESPEDKPMENQYSQLHGSATKEEWS